MVDPGMEPDALLEALLELARRAELEVRILSAAGASADLAPAGSAACRVGEKIWVVLAPDDPILHQSEVLAGALKRFRAEFLEGTFIAPGVRDFLEERREGMAERPDR